MGVCLLLLLLSAHGWAADGVLWGTGPGRAVPVPRIGNVFFSSLFD